MNAKYAISVARKMGASIFLLPEDIFSIKPKMVLTFIGTIMASHLKEKKGDDICGSVENLIIEEGISETNETTKLINEDSEVVNFNMEVSEEDENEYDHITNAE